MSTSVIPKNLEFWKPEEYIKAVKDIVQCQGVSVDNKYPKWVYEMLFMGAVNSTEFRHPFCPRILPCHIVDIEKSEPCDWNDCDAVIANWLEWYSAEYGTDDIKVLSVMALCNAYGEKVDSEMISDYLDDIYRIVRAGGMDKVMLSDEGRYDLDDIDSNAVVFGRRLPRNYDYDYRLKE